MDNTAGSLTQFQKSVIIGSLLGDAYLRIIPGRKNAFLEFNHSSKQSAYVDWKFDILKNYCRSKPKLRAYNTRKAYRFFTRSNKEFTNYYHQFYIDGKKVVPDNLIIDPLSLAVWYIDDGSKCGEDNVYLNTQQFTISDQTKLQSILLEFGIISRLNSDKKYFRIRIQKKSIDKFFSLISSYIIPSFRYKLGYDPVETCSEHNNRTNIDLISV